MKTIVKALTIAGLVAFMCGSARADYTGQTINGTLAFGSNGSNGGQQWSPSSITVPGTFSYADYANTDTAAFTGSSLTVTDEDFGGANGWEMTFSDPSMPFTSLTEVSSDFMPGLTYSLNGGVITLDWFGTGVGNVTYTATFDFTGSAATPEPSSLALLGTGLLGAMGMLRRRFV